MYWCMKHKCSLGLQASRKESDRISPACFTFSRGQGCRVPDEVLDPPLKRKKQSQENQAGANLVPKVEKSPKVNNSLMSVAPRY